MRRETFADIVDVEFFRSVMADVVELEDLIADLEMEAELFPEKAADIGDELSGLYAVRSQRS